MEAEDRSAPRWWARLGTVRVKTTAATVVVVGVAMVLGGLVLVATLRETLTEDLRSAIRVRAIEIAAAIEAGETPALTIGETDEQLIQVLGPGGDVVAASDNVDGLRPLVRLAPGMSTRFDPPIGDDEFVAVAAAADTSAGEMTVVFARALDAVSDSTETVAGLLALAAPLLLALVGATTWVVVGRALAPVEAIRSEVDEISTAELHRRVPEPEAQDEVAQLAATMNRMLTRLDEGQARQRRFVADASHELRSPVASIRQHAEVAAAHPDRSSLAELSDTVIAEARRMQHLVDDLLLLARVDEQTVQLRRRPVDLDDIVFAEATRLRSHTDLRVDTRNVSAGRVVGDEAGLRRVVRNLGDNAARHAQTTVAFALREQDGAVELTVDDDGPGVPPEDRQRVFERFVRLDGARARGDGGTGLGLAIVAQVVTGHGGKVQIADSPLGGARFRLRLRSVDDGPV